MRTLPPGRGIRRRGTRSGWHRPSPCRRATPCAGRGLGRTRMREAYRALRRYSRALEARRGWRRRCPRWGGICWSPAFAMTRSASHGWRPRPIRIPGCSISAIGPMNAVAFPFMYRLGMSRAPASGGHGAAWRRRARPVVPVELGPGSADTSAHRHRADRNRRHVGADGTGNRQ